MAAGSGPAGAPVIQDLLSEGVLQVNNLVADAMTTLGQLPNGNIPQPASWEEFNRRTKCAIGAIESMARMFVALAQDQSLAKSRLREILRIELGLRVQLRSRKKTTELFKTELRDQLRRLEQILEQFQTSRLMTHWPTLEVSPTLVHSIYSSGNMMLLLKLLAEASEDEIDIVTANYDFAHLKLLEILSRKCKSMRIIGNADSHDQFEVFPSLHNRTRLRRNLHCRAILAPQVSAVSSADLSCISYMSHLEVGILVDKTNPGYASFVSAAWTGGIPITQIGAGLSTPPYKTSHVLIGTSELARSGPLRSEVYRELHDEIYALLDGASLPGYTDTDESRDLAFVNVENLTPALDGEITTVLTTNFSRYLSIIPIHEVAEATERDARAQQLVQGGGKFTLLYLSQGPDVDVLQRSRRLRDLAGDVNSAVKFVTVSLDSGKVLQRNTRQGRKNETYLCIIHVGGFVGISNPLSNDEIQQFSMDRYLS